MTISVIIPTLNEEASIAATLKSLVSQNLKAESLEVIVADGGSSDRTVEIARRVVKVVASRPGRGCQMNSGADAASGDILLFLHADTILPANWHEGIISAMTDERVVGGAFSLSIESGRLSHRIIAASANARSRFLGLPYGDQGIFVRKAIFEIMGGYKDLPIMEDVDLVSRLKRLGRLVLLRDKVKTSARRWEKEGVFFTTLRNWLLMTLYSLGVPPVRLYWLYKHIR